MTHVLKFPFGREGKMMEMHLEIIEDGPPPRRIGGLLFAFAPHFQHGGVHGCLMNTSTGAVGSDEQVALVGGGW